MVFYLLGIALIFLLTSTRGNALSYESHDAQDTSEYHGECFGHLGNRARQNPTPSHIPHFSSSGLLLAHTDSLIKTNALLALEILVHYIEHLGDQVKESVAFHERIPSATIQNVPHPTPCDPAPISPLSDSVPPLMSTFSENDIVDMHLRAAEYMRWLHRHNGAHEARSKALLQLSRQLKQNATAVSPWKLLSLHVELISDRRLAGRWEDARAEIERARQAFAQSREALALFERMGLSLLECMCNYDVAIRLAMAGRWSIGLSPSDYMHEAVRLLTLVRRYTLAKTGKRPLTLPPQTEKVCRVYFVSLPNQASIMFP